MIEATGLRKRFGATEAVSGLDLAIAPGETFGLLGPNGAGKSTTIHMLVGVLAPDTGEVRIDGHAATDPDVRRRIGIAPQELAIYDELTAEENLAFFARVFGIHGARLRARIDWGLDFARLAERRRDRAGTFSGGMKRRLNLACAAVHGPAVLLCDEPSVGVDPQSRNHLFEAIERLASEGCTILYTTHYMEEAARLCDRVGIMDRGRMLAVDTVDALVAAHGGPATVTVELGADPPDTATLPGTRVGRTLSIPSAEPLRTVAEIGRMDLEVARLTVERPDLERVFLHLTGRSLRD
ncbi:MAG: ABC transporter ATP-binding protein [Nannocystaceae bacterium]